MTLPRDIDSLLRDWPFQPGVVARLIEAADGREVLQMRVEMGLVQMETEFRPDGDHPQGKRTYLEYIRGVAEGGGRAFTLSDEQCAEIDREFLQYYHRRICWLALREFSRAVVDANHTLDLMDFVRQHSPNEQWTVSHEQYRPFVLFHRTQAAALAEVEHSGPAAAIEQVRNGLRLIREVFRTVDAAEQYDDDELVRQLPDGPNARRTTRRSGRARGIRVGRPSAGSDLASSRGAIVGRERAGGCRGIGRSGAGGLLASRRVARGCAGGALHGRFRGCRSVIPVPNGTVISVPSGTAASGDSTLRASTGASS
jgi:hypothetical protein